MALLRSLRNTANFNKVWNVAIEPICHSTPLPPLLAI